MHSRTYRRERARKPQECLPVASGPVLSRPSFKWAIVPHGVLRMIFRILFFFVVVTPVAAYAWSPVFANLPGALVLH